MRADGRGLDTSTPPVDSTATTETEPAGSIDAEYASTLPTDPDALREALLDRIECPAREPGAERSLCLYNEILDLFTTYVVRPELAEATWRMLAGEIGFTSLGSVEDRAGRAGLGISLIPEDRPHYRLVLIISTQNGQLLGNEEILIKDHPDIEVEAPAVVSFNAIVAAKRTENDPQ